MRPHRVALIVAACVLVGACGNAPRASTLQHEPDRATLTDDSNVAGVPSAVANDLRLLRAACHAVAPTVVTHEPGTRLEIRDLRCQWISTAASGGAPRVVIGTVDGGRHRFDETAELLVDDRAVTGVGADARFSTSARLLTTLDAGRLWYVQLVADPATRAQALRVTSAIARALVAAAATG